MLLVEPSTVTLEYYTESTIQSHEILFRTDVSGISAGTELQVFQGAATRFSYRWNEEKRLLERRTAQDSPYPTQLGYEVLATVVETGRDVTGWSIGESAWIDAPHRETHLYSSRDLPPHRRLPQGVDPRHWLLFPLVRVALGAVHDAAPLVGDMAAVYGAGMVGQLCTRLLLLAGVRVVYLVDHDAARLAVAEDTRVIPLNSDNCDPADVVKSRHGGVDFAIEASGSYAALAQALRMIRAGGRGIVASSYGDQSEGVALGHEFHRNRITLISSMTVNGSSHPQAPRWNLDRLHDETEALMVEDRIGLARLPQVEIPFAEAQRAYDSLLRKRERPLHVILTYGDSQ